MSVSRSCAHRGLRPGDRRASEALGPAAGGNGESRRRWSPRLPPARRGAGDGGGRAAGGRGEGGAAAAELLRQLVPQRGVHGPLRHLAAPPAELRRRARNAPPLLPRLLRQSKAARGRALPSVPVRSFLLDLSPDGASFWGALHLQGCDASVMLMAPNGDDESHSGADATLSPDAVDAINKAKAAVEALPGCAGKVSCADILAMAARDVVSLVCMVTFIPALSLSLVAPPVLHQASHPTGFTASRTRRARRCQCQRPGTHGTTVGSSSPSPVPVFCTSIQYVVCIPPRPTTPFRHSDGRRVPGHRYCSKPACQ